MNQSQFKVRAYDSLASSAVKRVGPSHDCMLLAQFSWFEKVAQHSKAKPKETRKLLSTLNYGGFRSQCAILKNENWELPTVFSPKFTIGSIVNWPCMSVRSESYPPNN